MPNIHAINAQGTEYGITAENGITQAQVTKIETIGDVSALTTSHKQNTVVAINEVNSKIPTVQIKDLITTNPQQITPNTEVTVYTDNIALSANETPIGIVSYDAGWGVDAQRIQCKGVGIEINRANATCRLRCFVSHTYDSAVALVLRGSISILTVQS